MRRLAIAPTAEEDVAAAVRWYLDKSPELARAFRSAVSAALCTCRDQPLRHRRIHGDIRAVRLGRFPYRVFFITEPDRSFVIAILHVKRDPLAWQQRSVGE